jgi:hypothetical protein
VSAPDRAQVLATAFSVKAVRATSQTVEAVISAQVIDRDGEVLRARGCDASEYLENPVVLENHRRTDLPIGKALAVDVGAAEVVALIQWADHPRALAIARLYAEKFMRAFSVGFWPTKTSPAPLVRGQTGLSVLDWTLQEISAVTLPSNPRALARMLKGLALPDGATEDDFFQVWGALPAPKFYDLARAARASKEAAMPETDLDKLTADLEAATARAEAAERKTALTESRLAALERAPDREPPVLLDGRPFPLGDGRPVKAPGSQAPGHIHSRGEAPYALTKAVLAIAKGDKSLAPVEMDVSRRLERCGYQPTANGIMIPLGADALWRTEGHEEEIDRLTVELRQHQQ